jgi:hypothetical protein
LLLFCRLASQCGRFDKINQPKYNLTPRLQRGDEAVHFYPSKLQKGPHAIHLMLVQNKLGLAIRLVRVLQVLKEFEDLRAQQAQERDYRLVPWVNGVK